VTTTPAAAARRFSPLVLFVAAQVVLALVAPSVSLSGNQTVDASGAPLPTTPGAQQGATSDLPPGTVLPDGSVVAADGTITPAAGTPGSAGSSGNGSPGAPGVGGAPGTPGGSSTAAGAVDRSKCGPDGRQIGPSYYMPPCVPGFSGDNGGGSMTGVTKSQIRVMFVRAQSNPQLNAILKPLGLTTDPDEICDSLVIFKKTVEKRWELYGREVVWVGGSGNNSGKARTERGCKGADFFQSSCSISPPDVPCYRAEADLIASLKPAYVIAPVADQSFENQLGRNKIMIAGGPVRPQSYFDAVAPYHWDFQTNGSEAMRQTATYYCNYLAGRPVQFAGADIKPPAGAAPKRKVGVIFPATNGDPTYKIAVDEFSKQISGGVCGSAGDKALQYPYQSDITTAQAQSTSLVASMKNDKITTLVWFSDPLAPIFITSAMGQQNFRPENLITGIQQMDFDSLARLYDQTVWQYAFGVSETTNFIKPQDAEVAVAWKDGGGSGLPNASSRGIWPYAVLMANSFHLGGPKPTPFTIRDGLFRAPGKPSTPTNFLFQLGRPNSYTATRDARSVWWCGSRSGPDGQRGTWVPVNGGKRYQAGQWPGRDAKVFPNGTCNV
jgi:hypothetical protein